MSENIITKNILYTILLFQNPDTILLNLANLFYSFIISNNFYSSKQLLILALRLISLLCQPIVLICLYFSYFLCLDYNRQLP